MQQIIALKMGAVSGPTAGNNRFYTYDDHGNLLSVYGTGSPLVLSYSGNQLNATSVASGATYTYDADGRLSSVGSVSYHYNDLGLPYVKAGAGNVTKWTYSADGVKRSREATAGAGNRMDYVGNLVLRDGSLDRILIPGGYVWLPEGTAPVYCYNITDHLGSVRMVGDEVGTPLQVNHFDPFGNELDMSLSSNLIGSDPVLPGTTDINPYKFGGKEWDASLSMYDFSARMYDPSIGRFTTMDPLCEKYYSVSPYAYCNNNPVNLVDPEGQDFRKNRHFNTITISANYYVKDRASYLSAKQGVSFWNRRENDIYTDDKTGISYKIKYSLSVIEAPLQRKGDYNENTFEINDKEVDRNSAQEGRTTGVTLNNKTIYVKKSYATRLPNGGISTTAAHEIGHSLGMQHSDLGIMSVAQDDHRSNDVKSENIRQMMTSSAGKENVSLITRIYEILEQVFRH